MLQDGTKVHGSIGEHKFTGYISHYTPLCGIALEQAYIDREHVYMHVAESVATMPVNASKVTDDKGNWIEEIADVVGSECIPLPLSEIASQKYAAEVKHITLAHYREQVTARLTTYRTVKRAVTCEYGCKHVIDTREPVKPVLNDRQVNLSYVWVSLAEYVRYQNDCDYTTRSECWHSLASKLSRSGGLICWSGNYGTLPESTVKAIRAQLTQQYEDMCDDYLVAIMGKHLDRYIRHNSIFDGRSRRARIETRLNCKITANGIEYK